MAVTITSKHAIGAKDPNMLPCHNQLQQSCELCGILSLLHAYLVQVVLWCAFEPDLVLHFMQHVRYIISTFLGRDCPIARCDVGKTRGSHQSRVFAAEWSHSDLAHAQEPEQPVGRNACCQVWGAVCEACGRQHWPWCLQGLAC